jgi:hypothetical protein
MKYFLLTLLLVGCSNRFYTRTKDCSESIDIARNTEMIKYQMQINELKSQRDAYSKGLDYWIHECNKMSLELEQCRKSKK